MTWIEHIKEYSKLEEVWNTLPDIAKIWFGGQIDAFVEMQVKKRIIASVSVSCEHTYEHYENEHGEKVAVCSKCMDAYF